MSSLIIGLVGLQGSGKGTIANIIKNRHRAETFSFSGILKDILTRLSLEQNRPNLVHLSEGLRHAFGEDVLAQTIARDAIGSPANIVIIDGIRRLPDIAGLVKLPQFVMVQVTAPTDLRFARLRERHEKAGEYGMTREQFEQQESYPTEVTIPEVMKHATESIANDTTLEELTQRIDALITKLSTPPS